MRRDKRKAHAIRQICAVARLNVPARYPLCVEIDITRLNGLDSIFFNRHTRLFTHDKATELIIREGFGIVTALEDVFGRESADLILHFELKIIDRHSEVCVLGCPDHTNRIRC